MWIGLNDVELLFQYTMFNRQPVDNIWMILHETESLESSKNVEVWILWPMSSRSHIASHHELGKHFERQEQLSKGLVVVVREQPRRRSTVILSCKRKGTEGRQPEKSQNTWNELLDARYHILLWPGSYTKVIRLSAEQYGLYHLRRLIRGVIFYGARNAITGQISDGVQL